MAAKEEMGRMCITTLFLLCSFVVGVLRADDCLPKEDIWPCECSSSTAYLRNIECTHILKSEELIPPMRAIEKTKTKVDVLTIKYSSLSHLPDNIFRNTYIKKIEFLNTSIVSLTESGTPFHGLENILEHMQAMDVTFVSGLHFDQFRSLRKLKGINLDRCSMHSAVHHLPHLPELTSLRITNSEIAHISNKAFGSLPKLTVFDMQSNEITEVKRSMFSKPANSLEWIDLSNNILSSLPSDFFEKMPKIKKLYLQNNELVTLSAIPFSDVLRNGQLQEIHMTGNPLHCDCKISWLGSIRFPKEFHAKCSKPEAYSGKDISSLDFKSFRLEICNGDFLRLLLAYAKLSK